MSSIQSVAAVSCANDVLKKLEDISHNFPSRINSILTIKATEELAQSMINVHSKVRKIYSTGEGCDQLYINGNEINITRSDFTLYSLIDVLREEEQRLNALNKLNALNILPSTAKQFFNR